MTRAISGEAREWRLQVCSPTTTRPTTDRVRKGLFAACSLRLDLELARVLTDEDASRVHQGARAIALAARSGSTAEHRNRSTPDRPALG